jgi:hypothetical protein
VAQNKGKRFCSLLLPNSCQTTTRTICVCALHFKSTHKCLTCVYFAYDRGGVYLILKASSHSIFTDKRSINRKYTRLLWRALFVDSVSQNMFTLMAAWCFCLYKFGTHSHHGLNGLRNKIIEWIDQHSYSRYQDVWYNPLRPPLAWPARENDVEYDVTARGWFIWRHNMWLSSKMMSPLVRDEDVCYCGFMTKDITSYFGDVRGPDCDSFHRMVVCIYYLIVSCSWKGVDVHYLCLFVTYVLVCNTEWHKLWSIVAHVQYAVTS